MTDPSTPAVAEAMFIVGAGAITFFNRRGDNHTAPRTRATCQILTGIAGKRLCAGRWEPKNNPQPVSR